jgi:peptidoglycan/xylan/chitin deacetylase (PgdA/CDA1 family)
MQAEGHEIGLHCDQHVRHSERDAEWLRDDTDTALQRLFAIGVRPTLWRTPWGDTAPWSAAVAAERDLRLIGWTTDTHDWRGDSAAEMFVATRAALTDGAVVLAHDGLGPGARRDGAEATVDYVELVSEHAHQHGLALEALA